MKFLIFCLLVVLANCGSPRPVAVSDLTPENSFTENCEGPNVDVAGHLYVVNFQKDGTIGRVQFQDGRPQPVELFVTLPTGSTGNAIRFDPRGDLLVADFTGHNILKINGKTRETSIVCHDDRFHQPNDLALAKNGTLYATDPKWADGTGQIWEISPDGKAVILETNMGTTNGIELSPDERILYVNESLQRKIWAYDRSAAGAVSGKRLFAEFPDFCLDGMKCDPDGNLWVARWGKGTVAVFAPNGRLLREIAVKGKKVSNLAFSADGGRMVFVTVQDRKCVESFFR